MEGRRIKAEEGERGEESNKNERRNMREKEKERKTICASLACFYDAKPEASAAVSLSRGIERRGSTTITWHNSLFFDRVQCVFAALNKPLETCRAFIPSKFIKRNATSICGFISSLNSIGFLSHLPKFLCWKNHDKFLFLLLFRLIKNLRMRKGNTFGECFI